MHSDRNRAGGRVFCARDLGARLRALRVDHGLTQVQVGQRVGVGKSAVANYEAGRRLPGIDTLARLAALYGETVDRLVFCEEGAHV